MLNGLPENHTIILFDNRGIGHTTAGNRTTTTDTAFTMEQFANDTAALIDALVMTGTQDITSPPANSIVLAEKIPGAWLVQIEGGGHGLMFQYPEKFAKILQTFLAGTPVIA